MNVSIIIPTIRANEEMLQTCIQRVVETTGITPFIESGGSFAENCNTGAGDVLTDIVVFLNDDTLPEPGWLPFLVDPLIRDHTIGITGSRLLYPDGSIQHAGVYLAIEDGLLTARNICWNAASGEVQAVTGACMALRRDVFEKFGGFDETFRSGYEDIDLCLRVRETGYRVIYIAESTVIHYESQSGPKRWDFVNENIQRLQEKWNPGWNQRSNSEAATGSDGG